MIYRGDLYEWRELKRAPAWFGCVMLGLFWVVASVVVGVLWGVFR